MTLKKEISRYPCEHMAHYAEFTCEQHSNLDECHDAVIRYNAKFDEYSIPHGDGICYMVIQYCPWCGEELPQSKRDQWFDTLEDMGIEDPFSQEIPENFKNAQWWMKK